MIAQIVAAREAAKFLGVGGAQLHEPIARFDAGDVGWALRLDPADFDAEFRFGLRDLAVDEPAECLAGDVLRGRIKPFECPAFGTRCTPERPLGAPMVSSEGACAAYFNYGRMRAVTGER